MHPQGSGLSARLQRAALSVKARRPGGVCRVLVPCVSQYGKGGGAQPISSKPRLWEMDTPCIHEPGGACQLSAETIQTHDGILPAGLNIKNV